MLFEVWVTIQAAVDPGLNGEVSGRVKKRSRKHNIQQVDYDKP